MLGDRPLTVDDYLEILRRRLWMIVIPAILGPIVAYGISLRLKPRYTSQTLVLIEQQKIPEAFVKSVVTDELNARLTTMQEQILSRTRLQPIIEKFGMYKEEWGKASTEELVDRLRQTISVSPARTLVPSQNPNGGLPGFRIGVTGDDPKLAQQVCAEITSMFMNENLRIREQRSVGTTEFLAKQLEDAKRKLDDQDSRLVALKQRYSGQLPDQSQLNLNVLMSLTARQEAVTQSLNRNQQDKNYLDSLLAQQLTAWQASQTSNNPQTLEQQLATQQSQLLALEARYTSGHPDVVKARKDIAQLEKKIAEAATAVKDKPADDIQKVPLVEPSVIQQLRGQIHLAEQAIRENKLEQERLQEQIKTYQGRIQLSPVIEQQYKELTRDYQTALGFYNDLLSKKTQSEMATDLERRQQGEQFRVMDPANLPARPSFPDRQLFVAGGFGGGLGLGLAIALLLEMLDKSVRNERDVEFYLRVNTLALVPLIKSEKRRISKVWRRKPKPHNLTIRVEA